MRLRVAHARRGACAVALMGAVAACGKSPAAQAKQQLQTLRSWASSMRQVTAMWGAGEVPAAYASRTLQVAQQQLAKEQQQIQKAKLPPPLADPLRARAAHVSALTDSALDAVRRDDRAAAAAPARALAAASDSIAALAARLPGQ